MSPPKDKNITSPHRLAGILQELEEDYVYSATRRSTPEGANITRYVGYSLQSERDLRTKLVSFGTNATTITLFPDPQRAEYVAAPNLASLINSPSGVVRILSPSNEPIGQEFGYVISSGQSFETRLPFAEGDSWYDVLLGEEPSKSVSDEFDDLTQSTWADDFESGISSNYSIGLKQLLQLGGYEAIEELRTRIFKYALPPERADESLRIVGKIKDKATSSARFSLLIDALASKSTWIRHGATIGLSFLRNPKAVEAIDTAAQNEPFSELKDLMSQVSSSLQRKK